MSAAQLEQRRAAAIVHGARSEVTVERKARNHRRRFLRHAGLKAGDLDAIALSYLHLWARGMARLDLRDAGLVDDEKHYWHAYNAVKRAAESLERRLKELGVDQPSKRSGKALAEHVAHRYGGGGR